MKEVWDWLDGKKSYLALAAGAAVVILNKFGVHVPGVHLDPNAYSEQLWTMVFGASVRHAIPPKK